MRSEHGEETLLLEEFERRVADGRIGPTTEVRFSLLTDDRWVPAERLELFRGLYAADGVRFARAFSLARFPVVTLVLCVLHVGLYLAVADGSGTVSTDALLAAGAKLYAPTVELGQTWRLLTANVLHRDVVHLGFNVLMLLHLGGAIENVYRGPDYLSILVLAGLGTTGLSVAMSDGASVGASGLVFGALGAAVVFGFRYRRWIPHFERRYFGGAALIYALVIAGAGWSIGRTDNWGHIGGFVAGAAAAMLATPRAVTPEDGPATRRLALLTTVMTLVVLGTGPVLRARGPWLVADATVEDGLILPIPLRWRPATVEPLGYAGWGNGLGVRLGVRRTVARTGPVRLSRFRRSFVRTTLGDLAIAGDIADVRVLSERPVAVDGGRALVVDIALESKAGPLMTRTLLIERGYLGFAIVLSAPSDLYPAYEPLFERLIREVALGDTRALARRRAETRVFSGMSSVWVALGDQLALLGQVDAAGDAYRRALIGRPHLDAAHFGLVRLALDYDGDLEDEIGRAKRLHDRHPDRVAYATLLADIHQRLGQTGRACDVLQLSLDRTSMDVVPSDPVARDHLVVRQRTFGCRSGVWPRPVKEPL